MKNWCFLLDKPYHQFHDKISGAGGGLRWEYRISRSESSYKVLLRLFPREMGDVRFAFLKHKSFPFAKTERKITFGGGWRLECHLETHFVARVTLSGSDGFS
eukprot:UN27870